MSVEDEDSVAQLVADLKQKMGGEANGTVEIFLKRPGSLEYRRLPGQSIQTFDPDLVARRYGGGDYKFRFRSTDGKILGHRDINYDTCMKPEETEKLEPEEAPRQTDMNSVIISQLQQNQANMLAMFQTSMQSLSQAIAGRPAGPSMPEILQMVKELKTMVPEVQKENPWGLIKNTMEIVDRIKGEVGGSTDYADPDTRVFTMLAKAFEKLVEAKAAAAEPRTAAPAPVAAIAAPAPRTAAPAPQPAAQVQDPAAIKYPMIWQLISMKGREMVKAIELGSSPHVVVDQILSAIPESADTELSSFSQDPEAPDIMIRAYSSLQTHVDWIKRFVCELDKRFEDDGARVELDGARGG